MMPRIEPPTWPSQLRKWLPWAGFGLVAVVVIAMTSAWAATLRPSSASSPPIFNALDAPPASQVPAELPPPSIENIPAVVDLADGPAGRQQMRTQPVAPSAPPVAAPPPPAPGPAAAVVPLVAPAAAAESCKPSVITSTCPDRTTSTPQTPSPAATAPKPTAPATR